MPVLKMISAVGTTAAVSATLTMVEITTTAATTGYALQTIPRCRELQVATRVVLHVTDHPIVTTFDLQQGRSPRLRVLSARQPVYMHAYGHGAQSAGDHCDAGYMRWNMLRGQLSDEVWVRDSASAVLQQPSAHPTDDLCRVH